MHSDRKTAVYRHFDAFGRLLYVGISLCAFTRTRQHGMYADWFTQITRIELEWFDTRSQAETAEWQAIRNEKPLHNQTFNKKPQKVFLTKGKARRDMTKRDLARIRAENVSRRTSYSHNM